MDSTLLTYILPRLLFVKQIVFFGAALSFVSTIGLSFWYFLSLDMLRSDRRIKDELLDSAIKRVQTEKHSIFFDVSINSLKKDIEEYNQVTKEYIKTNEKYLRYLKISSIVFALFLFLCVLLPTPDEIDLLIETAK